MEKLARALVIFLASIALGIYAGLIALALAMPYRMEIDLRQPVIVAASVVASASLLYGLRQWWEIERADLPPKVLPAPTVTIVHKENDGRTLRLPPGCPASRDQLYTIAVRVIAGGDGVTYRDQQDLFHPQSAYKKFYNWLKLEGYAVDEGDGAKVTDEGMEFFSSLYQLPALPSPTEASYPDGAALPVTHTVTHHD